MYRNLNFEEDYKKIRTLLLNSGRYIIGQDGKVVSAKVAGAKDTPWIFINHDARKKFCGFWNGVCCLAYKLIPSHCRFNCWKTVIKPRNVKELFELFDILTRLQLPAKLGMDLRDYTHGAWAGFVYADTLEEGRSYYKAVREAVPLEIPVILKRGCTEMEQLLSSDKWDNFTDRDEYLERKLHDLFHFEEQNFVQAAWLKHEIKENWIRHAIKIGDPTARETAEKMSDDPNIWDRLVVSSVTYHEEEKESESTA